MKSRRLLAYIMLVALGLTMIPEAVLSQFGLEATVATDQLSYQLRNAVEIYGNVTYWDQPVDEGLIGIQVRTPLNNIVARTIPTGTENTGGWDVEIISFYASDDGGNPKSAFTRGDWAYFTVAIRNNKVIQQHVLLTINVYDSTLIPLSLESVGAEVNPGALLMYVAAVRIEKWASLGKAPAYANVYSDWPMDGGHPLGGEAATNFSIRESQYVSAPDNAVPEQTVENGSYATSFQLSPEPLPGVYTVYVKAWYKGNTASFQTVFSVVDVVAPPIAAFAALPPLAGANFTINFDGSFSSAEGYNDTITSYTWDFGDNSNSTGETVTHQYSNLGNYTVTLNVTDSEGFWNTTSRIIVIAEIHDIALTSLIFHEEIYSNWMVTAKVTLENKGTFSETFDVTTYYNGSIIGTKSVIDLDPLTQKTLSFQWNTTGLPTYVNYLISAETSIITGDINTTDNNITYGTTSTKNLGDIDGDRDTDIFDIVRIASIYGSYSGSTNWDIQADLVPNGEIDIFDVVVAAAEFGNQY
ncbi:MAG: PKD domain-containing protein [Candidatus Bathyarchaeota archaeon]|nr:PKD domain-containing protein [Candidatus Bathyarchaeota archaeon]